MAARTIQINLSADISNFQKNISKAERQIGSLGTELNTTMRKINANTQLMVAKLGNAGSATKKLAINLQSLGQKLTLQSSYVKRLKTELDTAKSKFGETSTQVKKLELQLIGAATAEQKMTNETERLNRALSKQGRLASAGSKMRTKGQGMMQGGVGVAAATTVPITFGLKKGIDYNALMEESVVAFKVLLGDAKKAEVLMGKFEKMAVKTPFETTDLTQQSKTLLNYGVSLENTIPLLNRLGDASLGNAQKMDSLIYGFSQIYSRGKLTGDNLKQLTDAGFNPLQEMAKKTGLSMSKLDEMMKKSQISVKDVVDALVDATSEGGRFFNAMNEQSLTFAGRLSTLRDSLNMTLGALTKPIFEKLTDVVLPRLIDMMDWVKVRFQELSPGWQSFISYSLLAVAAIGPLVIGLGAAIWAFGAVSTALSVATGLMGGLSAATLLLVGKLLLLAAAGIAIGYVAVVVMDNWKVVPDFFSALWERMKINFKMLRDMFLYGWTAIKLGFFKMISGLVSKGKTGLLKLYDLLGKIPKIGSAYEEAAKAIRATGDPFSEIIKESEKSLADLASGANGVADEYDASIKRFEALGATALNGIANTNKAIKDGFNDIFTLPAIEIDAADTKIGEITGLPALDASADKIKSSNKEIADNMTKLVDKLKDKATQFRDALGLFEKATVEKISGGSLLARLKGQLNVLTKYKSALDILKGKFGEGSLAYQQIVQLGPSAAGQVVALSRSNDKQLNEFSGTYNQVSGLAGDMGAYAALQENRMEQRSLAVNVYIQNAYGDSMKVLSDKVANEMTKSMKLQGVY